MVRQLRPRHDAVESDVAHHITPIEVKSPQRYMLTSLKKCMAKLQNAVGTPYVLHTADYKQEDGITYLPLYMTPLV